MNLQYPQNLLQDVFGTTDNLKTDIESILAELLNPRQIEIINLRYKNNLSYMAISKKYNLTRERIRQLKCKIHFKMRTNSRLFKTNIGDIQLTYCDNHNISIDELILSKKPLRALKRANINYVHQIIETPDEELIKIRGLGAGGIKEINEKIRDLGFYKSDKSINEAIKDFMRSYNITKKELMTFLNNMEEI